MSGRSGIDDSDLSALLDGALDDARRTEIEAALAADPALAGRLAAFAADKAMLKRLYAPLAQRPVPAQWIALARGKPPAPPRRWRVAVGIAAALVLALVCAAAWLRALPPAGGIVDAALDTRDEKVAGEQIVPVAAGTDAHQYDRLLTRTVALAVKAPDLGRMGYRLTGLHLYARSGGGAAELVYRDRQGRLFTLYLRHSDGAARFDQFERRGLRVCVWQDEEVGTVMAGNVSTAAMQRLASLAYTGLTL